MKRLVSIGEASRILGVSISTLRRWEKEGKIKPDTRTRGGQRRYKLSSILTQVEGNTDSRITIAYARVSSYDQKEDLERQKKVLEMYCATKGWDFEIISDLGSGINYNKKGLKKLINLILNDKVNRLVITHKDMLLRFGAELIFALCEAKEVEVVIINKGENVSSFEEELAKDVLEIITVFSARLYGKRSNKNKKLIEDMQKAVNNAISSQDKA